MVGYIAININENLKLWKGTIHFSFGFPIVASLTNQGLAGCGGSKQPSVCISVETYARILFAHVRLYLVRLYLRRMI